MFPTQSQSHRAGISSDSRGTKIIRPRFRLFATPQLVSLCPPAAAIDDAHFAQIARIIHFCYFRHVGRAFNQTRNDCRRADPGRNKAGRRAPDFETIDETEEEWTEDETPPDEKRRYTPEELQQMGEEVGESQKVRVARPIHHKKFQRRSFAYRIETRFRRRD